MLRESLISPSAQLQHASIARWDPIRLPRNRADPPPLFRAGTGDLSRHWQDVALNVKLRDQTLSPAWVGGDILPWCLASALSSRWTDQGMEADDRSPDVIEKTRHCEEAASGTTCHYESSAEVAVLIGLAESLNSDCRVEKNRYRGLQVQPDCWQHLVRVVLGGAAVPLHGWTSFLASGQLVPDQPRPSQRFVRSLARGVSAGFVPNSSVSCRPEKLGGYRSGLPSRTAPRDARMGEYGRPTGHPRKSCFQADPPHIKCCARRVALDRDPVTEERPSTVGTGYNSSPHVAMLPRLPGLRHGSCMREGSPAETPADSHGTPNGAKWGTYRPVTPRHPGRLWRSDASWETAAMLPSRYTKTPVTRDNRPNIRKKGVSSFFLLTMSAIPVWNVPT